MIQGSMGVLCGMPVMTSPHIPKFKLVQHKIPKSKGRRIRKKWAQDTTNFKQVPITSVYIFNNYNIIMHPDTLHHLGNHGN